MISWNAKLVEKIYVEWCKGTPVDQISEEVGISAHTVVGVVTAMRKEGISVPKRHRAGQRKLSIREFIETRYEKVRVKVK